MFEVAEKPQNAQAQKFVMILGFMSSSICFFLGYPCVPPGWITLSFRATCVGYFACNFVPYFLGPCLFSHRVLRGAMVTHSISSFIVSAFWCVGFGEWFLLMLMVHLFQFLGSMVLLERGVKRHVLFTLSGNIVTYFFRVEQVDVPSMDPRLWAACTETVVVALVIGMWNSKHKSIEFLKQKFGAMSKILTLSNEEMERRRSSRSSTTAGSGVHESCGVLLPRLRTFIVRSGFEKVDVVSSAWIDGLEILHRVGQGAFGKVYFCRYQGSNAAVKIMSWKQKIKSKVNPVREAELCLKLQHPNLVRTYAFFMREVATKAQEMWIIQEWCNLGTLNDYAASRPYEKPKGGAKIRRVLTDVCKATAYLHATDVIHGDLTSKNVLLQSLSSNTETISAISAPEKVVESFESDDVRSFDVGFTCKVCDFGLARVLEEGRTELLTSQLGTVSHMPPELLLEGRRLSKKADIWAIGMILYEMLLGEIPYRGMLVPSIILFVASGQRLSLPDHVFEEFFRHVFDWCAQFDLNQRPSAEELVSYIAEHEHVQSMCRCRASPTPP